MSTRRERSARKDRRSVLAPDVSEPIPYVAVKPFRSSDVTARTDRLDAILDWWDLLPDNGLEGAMLLSSRSTPSQISAAIRHL